MLEPYAIVTARNVVRSLWTERDRQRRNQHRVLELTDADAPDEQLLKNVDAEAVSEALTRLTERERATLLAHEVSGRDTKSLATDLSVDAGCGSRPAEPDASATAGGVPPGAPRRRATIGAVPSGLVVAVGGRPPPAGEVGAARHLLECAGLRDAERAPDGARSAARQRDRGSRSQADSDVVQARKGARDLAARLGFSRTEMTVIATAVSEISRNIVRFAERGEVFLELLDEPRPGLRVVARDTGPGIPDVERALSEGYSTYSGLGLGLPGARRLMDEFDIASELGRGTTITMTKWRREG